MKKNEDKLIDKDIQARLEDERKNKPKKAKPPKKTSVEAFIGITMFIIVLANMLYLIVQLFVNK